MTKEEYDFIVMGAGVTGMSAAMYSARLGMKTLCLGYSHGSEMPLGGVITTTDSVENYPGFTRISGEELAEKIMQHALSYELVKLKEENAEKIEKKGKEFIVKTNKNEYLGKSVLFATGTTWKRVDAPGAKQFENRGIAFCALCDAPLFKNKTVAVIGGSDSAVKDALVIAEHAKKVYIIYRGEKVRAEPVNLGRMKANKKIEVINNANVLEFKGKNVLEKVILDREFNGTNELLVNGVFVAIGHIPLSELAKEIGVKLNEKGEIMINHKTSETNIGGVYAAGDVADKPFKQAITGVAEGCTAAHSAFEYLGKGNAN